MNEFPSILNVKNKEKFPEIYYDRVLSYIRRDIYEHVIKEEENNYFDLDIFQKKYNLSTEVIDKIVQEIMKELENLGWNCKLSFADTGLFIYSTDKPPANCW